MRTTTTILYRATLLLSAAMASSHLPAQVDVATVVSNGDPADSYDIVIIGDGYRASEQTQFNADVDDVVSYFRDNGVSYPHDAYWSCYNVHRVFRASNESGADDPNAGIVRDTVYGASYNVGNTQRCLYLATTAGRNQATMDAAQAPDTDGRIVVLVNSSQYGGCASTFSVSYNGSSMEAVQLHEWGHSFGGLADEYDTGRSGPYTGPELGQANVTNSATGNKWQPWLGFAGQYGTVGAYEGARYHQTGVWRPEPRCVMRSLNLRNCTICREQLIKVFNRSCVMLRDPQPAPALLSIYEGRTQQFSFTNILASRPHSIEWSIDNGPWAPGTASFGWDTTGVSAGLHTVRARLTDTSPDVRSDPNNDLVHVQSWPLRVLVDPGAATNYGAGCGGMTLSANSTPAIGSTLGMTATGLPNNTSAAALLIGLNRENLPLDLAGMPGCTLLVGGDTSTIGAVSIGSGNAAFSIPVTNDPGAIGGVVQLQGVAVSPGSTPLGVILSNGVTLTIGAGL